MKQRLAIFLAVIFLATQMLSFQHMAEHGFKDHNHSGHPCQISLYFQQSHSFDSATNTAEIVAPQNYISVTPAFVQVEPVLTFSGFTRHSRAPPHLA